MLPYHVALFVRSFRRKRGDDFLEARIPEQAAQRFGIGSVQEPERLGAHGHQGQERIGGGGCRRAGFGPFGAALGASPLTSAPKASSIWFFHRLVRTRSPSFLPTPPFWPSVIAPPTMPSSDFCAAIAGLATRAVREAGHGTDLPR